MEAKGSLLGLRMVGEIVASAPTGAYNRRMQSTSWAGSESGKGRLVTIIIILALAAGGFWFYTFGQNRMDFFTLQRELKEDCWETANTGRSSEDFLRQSFTNNVKKHGYDFIDAEDHIELINNVDGSITCVLQYERTVDYPLVDKSTTLIYSYGCKSMPGNTAESTCEEVSEW